MPTQRTKDPDVTVTVHGVGDVFIQAAAELVRRALHQPDNDLPLTTCRRCGHHAAAHGVVTAHPCSRMVNADPWSKFIYTSCNCEGWL